jgi:hypothetical protein
MKTLIIRGSAPVPDALRDVIARGSTSLQERRASEVSPSPETPLAADRVVFWASRQDRDVYALAERYARAEAAERREVIVFVAADEGSAPPRLASTEVFAWPQDEDRLKMAFMTGA